MGPYFNTRTVRTIFAWPTPQYTAHLATNLPTREGVTVTTDGLGPIITTLFMPISGIVIPCKPCVLTKVSFAGRCTFKVIVAGVNAKFRADTLIEAAPARLGAQESAERNSATATGRSFKGHLFLFRKHARTRKGYFRVST